MNLNLKLSSRMHGERALLTAVVVTALRDAVNGSGEPRADAWRYFASPVYETHLAALGLPAGIVPAAIKEKAAYDEQGSGVLADVERRRGH
jgi:hypothetical protein